jgi:glycosyltransferase involved in cell wall biosynthesis
LHGVNVAVDARALAGSRGVTRYTRSLLEAMARGFPGDRWLLFVPGRGELPGASTLCRLPNVELCRHPLPGRLLFGAAAVAGRPRLDRLVGARPDVVWAPAVAPLALSAGVPLVLTIHDLSFEQRPEDFTAYERLWHRLARPRALGARARLVIVPAPATRELLIGRWGIDAARVHVVPEGADGPAAAGDRRAVLAGLDLAPRGYLMAAGALEPRKAPLLLARAYSAARARGLAAELVFAGEGRLAAGLHAPGVRLLGRVGDDELDALYAEALALVMPSLLEGYGLPAREALARGTPAIVSDLPAFGPELSPAVVRVPVGDEAALTEALLAVERDERMRAELAAAALGAVQGLTWAAAGQRTRELLAQAAAS